MTELQKLEKAEEELLQSIENKKQEIATLQQEPKELERELEKIPPFARKADWWRERVLHFLAFWDQGEERGDGFGRSADPAQLERSIAKLEEDSQKLKAKFDDITALISEGKKLLPEMQAKYSELKSRRSELDKREEELAELQSKYDHYFGDRSSSYDNWDD